MSQVGPEVFDCKNRVETIRRISLLKPLKYITNPICHSAVLLPLCFYQNVPSLLFIKRPINLRTHPGQIAFPGGKVDVEDKDDYICTALRESFEEIALDSNSVDVWTTLPTLTTNTSIIHPVVGYCGHISSHSFSQNQLETNVFRQGDQLLLKPNDGEVSMIFIRSLDWLTDSKNLATTNFCAFRVNLLDRTHQPSALCYHLPVFGNLAYSKSEPPRIWGITAAMAYMLIRCLLPGRFNNFNVLHKLSTIAPVKFFV